MTTMWRDPMGKDPVRGLFTVALADPATRTITLKSPAKTLSVDLAKHPVLRRWEKPLQPVTSSKDFSIELEAGIAIRFEPSNAIYRAGDYWLIPARTADGGTLLWPRDDERTASLHAPSGVVHRP